jgi:hypothetical protein
MTRVYGTVTRGPTAPVCRAGTPCTEPASGARIDFTSNDTGAVAHAVVAKDGGYSVSLWGGYYLVTVSPQPPIGRGITPGRLHVFATVPGYDERVDFRIDTGLR